MNRKRYHAIAAYAGEWLDQPLPGARPVDEVADLAMSTGVYVVCDALERVRYVGSVRRPQIISGLDTRLREHLRDPVKRLTWHTVWVVPLHDETPIEVVRRLEGAVGMDLRPLSSQRLPRI
jgi:hypothetical protein